MKIVPTMLHLSSKELVAYIEGSRDNFTPLEELMFIHLAAKVTGEVPQPVHSVHLSQREAYVQDASPYCQRCAPRPGNASTRLAHAANE